VHLRKHSQGLSSASERHLAHFPRGTADETWLPLVGSMGWILLTTDKRIRYNLLEKRALAEHAVREFVFASGNMSGQDMADALELALPKMRRLSRKLNPPSSPPLRASAKSTSAGRRSSPLQPPTPLGKLIMVPAGFNGHGIAASL